MCAPIPSWDQVSARLHVLHMATRQTVCPATVLCRGSDISPFPFAAGCHLHFEHTTNQCQFSGAGPKRAEQPSAAAAGHEGLPGTLRPHSESLFLYFVVLVCAHLKDYRGCCCCVTDYLFPSVLSDVFVPVSKVEELDHLNIIHVTGTKGKVS